MSFLTKFNKIKKYDRDFSCCSTKSYCSSTSNIISNCNCRKDLGYSKSWCVDDCCIYDISLADLKIEFKDLGILEYENNRNIFQTFYILYYP